MAKYVKWIGGALGWALGGPIGGVLGFAFGSMFDDKSFVETAGGTSAEYKRKYQQYRHQTNPGDFASALIVLSASVMKADGKLMKSELRYIHDFFKRQFGEEIAQKQMDVLQEVLKKDIPLREVCGQIKYFMEHQSRLQLLHYLFGIAKADGNVDATEVSVIQNIANYLGISTADYESVRGMFYKDSKSAYKVLEITNNATDTEIKTAYRRMANKYHPDKVRHLGDEHQSNAKEMFLKVQEAYEVLKKERGFK
jgi:DnaJ like chaperone protein